MSPFAGDRGDPGGDGGPGAGGSTDSAGSRLCFPEVQDQLAGLWLGLDTLSDVLYVGDIGVRLHTGA